MMNEAWWSVSGVPNVATCTHTHTRATASSWRVGRHCFDVAVRHTCVRCQRMFPLLCPVGGWLVSATAALTARSDKMTPPRGVYVRTCLSLSNVLLQDCLLYALHACMFCQPAAAHLMAASPHEAWCCWRWCAPSFVLQQRSLFLAAATAPAGCLTRLWRLCFLCWRQCRVGTALLSSCMFVLWAAAA